MADNKDLREICGRCGFTNGSHHGGTGRYPFNCCPGHEGRMDWNKGPGTIFLSTREYKNEDNNNK